MPRSRDDYFGDVVYETWRRGGNPDLVDRDDIETDRRDDVDPFHAAGRYIQSANTMECENCGRTVGINGCDFCLAGE